MLDSAEDRNVLEGCGEGGGKRMMCRLGLHRPLRTCASLIRSPVPLVEARGRRYEEEMS